MIKTQATGIGGPSITDEELMQGIVASNHPSLDLLYARYRPLIYGIILQVLPNAVDAEEALQDTFLSVWNQAGRFDAEKGRPLGWIICLARRRAIDRYRKLSRRFEVEVRRFDDSEEGPNASDIMLANVSGSGDEAVRNDLRRLLATKLESLPTEQSRVIDLIYFKEMSQRQVAAHTGIPLGTVKTRIQLGLCKLAKELMPLRLELC